MSSINTNASAMTALQSLRNTNASMEHTQTAISTGFRVAGAKDNAAYWSIATTMRSDNKAMSTVQDALGLGAATIDVAYTAIESSIKVTDENVLDYLRFFCFFVRGEEGPFLIAEDKKAFFVSPGHPPGKSLRISPSPFLSRLPNIPISSP